MKTAMERLREKLNTMEGRIGGVTLNDYVTSTAEEVAEELLLMIESIELGKFEELDFGDSKTGSRHD